MITRIKEKEVQSLLKQFLVVAIIGPRQCGKTTIAKKTRIDKKLTSLYFDLESPADFTRFHDPEYFLQSIQAQMVIIDEVQRKPELFFILRSLVDKNKKKGKYLLLGSASPHLVRGISETLAGRIAYCEVAPFNLIEVYKKQTDLNKLWFRGGFPDAWLSKSETMWFTWMDNFFRTFIERDLNNLFGVNFSSPLMYKLWRMLAHFHGQAWNAQTFAKGLDVSAPTVNKYIDYLEGAFMIRKLPAFYTNAKKRIVKSPKIYIRDSGLLHYLIDITKSKNVIFNPAVGYSWEGYAIEQILQLVPNHIKAYYYRTHDGSEMDLLLVNGLVPIACIELKTTNNPQLTRSFYESVNDLKCLNNFVVTPFQEVSYKAEKNITICGLHDFLLNFLPKLLKIRGTLIKK
ncbi:MAG: ATP-binding protein [Bacteroidota bacterium]|nr:ATP-binding protein [Bacteroidota bacterium]